MVEGLGEGIQELARHGSSIFLVALTETGPKVRPGGMADAVQREEAQGAEGLVRGDGENKPYFCLITSTTFCLYCKYATGDFNL